MFFPGSELAFKENITEGGSFFSLWNAKVHDYKVGKVVQINTDNAYMHHDAIELPDGKIVLINNLNANTKATVLQLPAEPKPAEDTKAEPAVQDNSQWSDWSPQRAGGIAA